ncbi:MAG: D-alanyl-D-alanine carboxypeptidase [Oscillospiraceae bacterium]|jgi:D-alanyl-D-alanine carboxypeptidase (penicillin-binding protein 5/6)|nr:D-alanyl-D-alanine carboxypeptidase [Oscillospiraceae bacterium]
MEIKKRSLWILVALILLIPPGVAANTYSELPKVDVRSAAAILVYPETGEILYQHNIDTPREPASITKIMTVLLGVEHGALEELVTIEESDYFDIVEGSSSVNPPLKVGEEMTLNDLLYCAMVASDNAACNVIARHVSGSVDSFLETLAERLKKLGCENTVYTNTHGLPDPNHITTAYDIYLMARECMNNQTVMEMAHTEIHDTDPTNLNPEGRQLITTNNLITRRRFPDYIYPEARGIKTGNTNAAGHCLVSCAERDGKMLVSVVLGATVDEDTNLIRSFTETRDLFNWGFDNFSVRNILNQKNPLTSVKVLQGLRQDTVNLVPARGVETLLPNHLDIADIERSVTVYHPEGVQAPVVKGDLLGELRLSYEGHDYGTIPLMAALSVERDNIQATQDNVTDFIDKVFGTPTAENSEAGSLRWILWAALGFVALLILYVVVTIVLNVRRRRRRRSYNYRGKKRYR